MHILSLVENDIHTNSRTTLRISATTASRRFLLVGIAATALISAGCSGGSSSGESAPSFSVPVLTSADTVTLRQVFSETSTLASTGEVTTSNPETDYDSALGSPFGYLLESDTAVITRNVSGIGTVQVATHLTDGKASSYDYFTNTSSGIRYFGTDDVDDTGALTFTVRVSPAAYYPSPATLSVGESDSETFTITSTDVTTHTLSYSGTVHATYTLLGYEDVTVPAGTFKNAAKFNVTITTNSAASAGFFASQDTVTGTEWVASGLGEIKEETTDTSKAFNDDNSLYATYVSTEDIQLAYSSVGGVVYGTPPAAESRAAKRPSSTIRRVMGMLGVTLRSRH